MMHATINIKFCILLWPLSKLDVKISTKTLRTRPICMSDLSVARELETTVSFLEAEELGVQSP